MKAKKPKNAVFIVEDQETIQLLADFTRAEIIRLLSIHSMTEKQLSDELGITKTAVGYHLHLLLDAGLIEIARLETENTASSKNITLLWLPCSLLIFATYQKMSRGFSYTHR